jgi:hypothetical protein
MPHFKCVTCRTRLSAAGVPVDVCDGCGSPFEPVVELAELFGYRAITAAGRLEHAVMQAQARRDAERWVDEGGAAAAIAVALHGVASNPGER